MRPEVPLERTFTTKPKFKIQFSYSKNTQKRQKYFKPKGGSEKGSNSDESINDNLHRISIPAVFALNEKMKLDFLSHNGNYDTRADVDDFAKSPVRLVSIDTDQTTPKSNPVFSFSGKKSEYYHISHKSSIDDANVHLAHKYSSKKGKKATGIVLNKIREEPIENFGEAATQALARPTKF